MRTFQPKIFHKGLILLAVPLLFEVTVAATLLYLQHFYGEAVKAEVLRKQIIFHTNEFWYWNIRVTTTNLARAFLAKEPDWSVSRVASREAERIKRLVKNDPKQSEQLDKILQCADRSLQLCFQIKPFLSEGESTFQQILTLRSNLLNIKHLINADVETGTRIREFREHELRESAKAAERVHMLASMIQLLLIGAIVGSVALAYLLFRYFMSGIHKGVHTLTTNIQRFKAGQELVPAIEGADELAVLDQRFHEMADEVAKAQRMKQSFLSTVSSELREPISSTKDYLMRLSRGAFGEVSEEAAMRAGKAEQTLERLIGLMNDLLALQTPGEARIEISPRMCALSEVIQASIDSVSAFADKSGVRLESSAQPLQAYADPDRIVQVLVNLLSNAIKFSPAGAAVEVSASQLDGQIEVRVKDHGRGVPAHLRDAIFEKFQQVAATDATEKGGTGLGLPICKEIVQRHQGSIGVESEEGKGSTFWFRLPAAAPAKE
ncbi:MAG TPA: HAMP domain-containing sensor histidine kinase [Candidatus Obscuribacterales bacterium]